MKNLVSPLVICLHSLHNLLVLIFQVKRELPRWLREPIIIRAGAGLRQDDGDDDDHDDTVMNLLDEDLRKTLRQNEILHFFPGSRPHICAHHLSSNVFIFVHIIWGFVILILVFSIPDIWFSPHPFVWCYKAIMCLILSGADMALHCRISWHEYLNWDTLLYQSFHCDLIMSSVLAHKLIIFI